LFDGPLVGLLDFRAMLYRFGLEEGFQWLDGSFLENIELLESRAPRDIDVVTFVPSMASIPESEQDVELDHAALKDRFHVDAYFVETEELPAELLISVSAYWYSVWSHRRTHVWKGYLQIRLDPAEDTVARAQWSAEPLVTGSTE